MSFKIHLIIVSVIIIVVYGVWQLTSREPTTVVTVVQNTASPYSISITHASWGLNCRFRAGTDNTDGVFSGDMRSADRLREDNVLLKVSQLCNGKIACEVPINVDTLGEDPAPICDEKLLEVEYRCFSYDRPWKAKAARGRLTIDCNRSKD